MAYNIGLQYLPVVLCKHSFTDKCSLFSVFYNLVLVFQRGIDRLTLEYILVNCVHMDSMTLSFNGCKTYYAIEYNV